MDELVGQALAGLGADAARVRLEIRPETPPVEVDAAQVERVLANLIDNALHYSPPGSGVVVRAESGATELRLHVVDRGPGLPAEERDALFQPFRRGSAGQLGSGPRPRRSRAASPRRTAAGSGRRTIRPAATSSSRCRSRSARRRCRT